MRTELICGGFSSSAKNSMLGAALTTLSLPLSDIEALTFSPLRSTCCSDILPHTFTVSIQNYGAVK